MRHTSFESTFSGRRILYGTWILGSFILVNAYSSVLYAILTVPEPGRPIDTVEDLITAANTDSHYIITKDRSATLASILNATPNNTLYYALKQQHDRLRRPQMRYVSDMVPFLEQEPRNVIFMLKISALVKRYLEAKILLHVGSETLESIYLGWVMRKKDPLVPFFNEV